MERQREDKGRTWESQGKDKGGYKGNTEGNTLALTNRWSLEVGKSLG